MTLGDLNALSSYLITNYSELTDQPIAAEHDEIYLPMPKVYGNELLTEIDKYGCYIDKETDSIVCFV